MRPLARLAVLAPTLAAAACSAPSPEPGATDAAGRDAVTGPTDAGGDASPADAAADGATAVDANDVDAAPVAPTLEVHAPAPDDRPHRADRPVMLTWTAVDPDSVAQVRLYRDDDGAGADGTLIAGPIDENDGLGSWAYWDAPPLGVHHVYGVIDDGEHAPVIDHAPGTVEVYDFARTTWAQPDATPCTDHGAGPFAFYLDDGRLWLGHDAGGGYTASAVTVVGANGWVPACAAGPGGSYVAVFRDDSASPRWRLVEGTPGSWSVGALPTSDAPDTRGLAVSPAGDLAFCATTDAGPRVWRRDGAGAWTSSLVSSHAPGYHCTARFAPDGTLHVVYGHRPGGLDTNTLVIARDTGAGWALDELGPAAPYVYSWHLAFDGQGAPAVAFAAATTSAVTLARRQAGAWSLATVTEPGAPQLSAREVDLAFDAQGAPVLAILDYAGGTRLTVAHLAGPAWRFYETHESSTTVPSTHSLSLGAGAWPELVYFRNDANELRRVRRLAP